MAWPPPVAAGWVGLAAALGVLFLVGNLALQYGAARLPANRTAVVMLTEVFFAAASAVALGGEVLTWPLAIGGVLIGTAALLATPLRPASRRSQPRRRGRGRRHEVGDPRRYHA